MSPVAAQWLGAVRGGLGQQDAAALEEQACAAERRFGLGAGPFRFRALVDVQMEAHFVP
jgi:hypothetical protein